MAEVKLQQLLLWGKLETQGLEIWSLYKSCHAFLLDTPSHTSMEIVAVPSLCGALHQSTFDWFQMLREGRRV
jgi:hypothetical protein